MKTLIKRKQSQRTRPLLNVHSYLFTGGVILLMLIGMESFAAQMPLKFKFKNNTGVTAKNLHLQFAENDEFTMYCEVGVSWNPPPVIPANAFKSIFRSKAKGSPRQRIVNYIADPAKGGVGVAPGQTVEINLMYDNVCPCKGCVPPKLIKVWWTNSGKFISNEKPAGQGGDRIGDYLKYDKVNQYYAMAPATGNGQMKISVDGFDYFFQQSPGDDGVQTAIKFSAFIDTVVEFGAVLDTLIDNNIDYTAYVFDNNPNIEVTILQQDLTQPVFMQMEPVAMPPNFVGHQQMGPGDFLLQWQPDPLADHYIIRGLAAGSTNIITIPVSANSNGQLQVHGLPEQKTYYWVVSSVYNPNNNNVSGYSSIDTIYTGCRGPQTISGFTSSPTSYNLNWDVISGVDGYEVILNRISNNQYSFYNIAGGSANVYSLTGLVTGEEYLVGVRSVCQFNGILNVSPISATTAFTAGAGISQKADKQIAATMATTEVYPNPANAGITIKWSALQNETTHLNIFDLAGRSVYSHQVDQNDLRHELKLDTRNWADGVYNLVTESAEEVKIQKIVIAH